MCAIMQYLNENICHGVLKCSPLEIYIPQAGLVVRRLSSGFVCECLRCFR